MLATKNNKVLAPFSIDGNNTVRKCIIALGVLTVALLSEVGTPSFF